MDVNFVFVPKKELRLSLRWTGSYLDNMAVSAQGCRAVAAASTTLGCWGGVWCKGPTEAFSFLVGSVLLRMLDIEKDVYSGDEAFACTLDIGDPALGPAGDFLLGLAGGDAAVRLMGWKDMGPVVPVVELVIW
jgi:hypothetical protein